MAKYHNADNPLADVCGDAASRSSVWDGLDVCGELFVSACAGGNTSSPTSDEREDKPPKPFFSNSSFMSMPLVTNTCSCITLPA
jgi:hypothetical protein